MSDVTQLRRLAIAKALKTPDPLKELTAKIDETIRRLAALELLVLTAAQELQITTSNPTFH